MARRPWPGRSAATSRCAPRRFTSTVAAKSSGSAVERRVGLGWSGARHHDVDVADRLRARPWRTPRSTPGRPGRGAGRGPRRPRRGSSARLLEALDAPAPRGPRGARRRPGRRAVAWPMPDDAPVTTVGRRSGWATKRGHQRARHRGGQGGEAPHVDGVDALGACRRRCRSRRPGSPARAARRGPRAGPGPRPGRSGGRCRS